MYEEQGEEGPETVTVIDSSPWLFLRRQKGVGTKACVQELVLEDSLLYGKNGLSREVGAGRL